MAILEDKRYGEFFLPIQLSFHPNNYGIVFLGDLSADVTGSKDRREVNVIRRQYQELVLETVGNYVPGKQNYIKFSDIMQSIVDR